MEELNGVYLFQPSLGPDQESNLFSLVLGRSGALTSA